MVKAETETWFKNIHEILYNSPLVYLQMQIMNCYSAKQEVLTYFRRSA